jgi:hypothetical protein
MLDGPIRDHLEDTASDTRVAHLESRIAARRSRTRPINRAWPVIGLGLAGAMTALLWFSSAPPPAPPTPIAVRAPEPDPYLGAKIVAVPEPALAWMRADDALMAFELGLGRADFTIPSDTDRRWVIDAGLAKVEVVGTTFSIARFADRVTVAVEKGLVKVSAESLVEPKYLGAGEAIEIRANVANAPAAPPVIAPKKIAPSRPSVDALWDRADAARAQGDHRGAVERLADLVGEYPADPRAGLASFVRARILMDQLAAPKEAAQAIALALSLGLAEDLEESARSRLFLAHAAAHDQDAAERAAREYLAKHPDGRHAREAQTIVDPR